MPEQEPYAPPDDVEEFIRRHARRFSGGDPMLAEDLERKARLRARQEAAAGEEKPQYLPAGTRRAISNYMQNGIDVDGRPWPRYERDHVWEIWSLEHPLDEKGTTHADTLADDSWSIEEQALGRMMVWHLYKLLDTEDGRLLAWKREGRYHQEIALEEGMSERRIKQAMRRVREKTRRYLTGLPGVTTG